MKVKRRIEIVMVREKTYQFSDLSALIGCGFCGSSDQLLAPTLAANLSGISQRTLFRWIESGDIHFVETPEGNIFLCLDSVKARAIHAEREVVFSHGSCTTTGT